MSIKLPGLCITV